MDAEKIDRLFLSKGCPDCAPVRAVMRRDASEDDSFRGTGGQALMVFAAMSDSAARALLDRFGHHGKFTPLLETSDGKTLDKSDQIVAHLKRNGMAVES